MLDNELIRLLISIINQGLSLRNISGVTILQAFQPTQQGAVSTPCVYISKVSDTPIGCPKRLDVYDSSMEKMNKSEIQVYETQYQIMGLFPQNALLETLTASDLTNIIRQIVQSDECISTLLNNGAQVLRVTNIRDPYFKDDRDYFEMSPSFDVSIIHNQTFTNEIGYLNEGDIIPGIYPI